MSDIDPTPGTPITLGDRLSWLRGDVTANQLATLAELAALRGVPATTLAELAAQQTALAAQLAAQQTALAAQLAELGAAIGTPPNDGLTITTVRGLLYGILQRLTSLAYGDAPINGGDYVSSGEIFYDGRKYATFDGPIAGVTISADKRQLTNSNWSGWEFYIQTTDPSPWVNGIPTQPNGWLALGLFSTVNFSVEGQYPIKVYLRFVASNVTCYPATSINVVGTSYIMMWTNPPFTITNKPGNENRYSFILEDVNGWTVKNNSGASVSVIAWARPFSGALAVNVSLPAGGTYTFTDSVIYAFVEATSPLSPSDFLFCEPVLLPS